MVVFSTADIYFGCGASPPHLYSKFCVFKIYFGKSPIILFSWFWHSHEIYFVLLLILLSLKIKKVAIDAALLFNNLAAFYSLGNIIIRKALNEIFKNPANFRKPSDGVSLYFSIEWRNKFSGEDHLWDIEHEFVIVHAPQLFFRLELKKGNGSSIWNSPILAKGRSEIPLLLLIRILKKMYKNSSRFLK